MSKNLNMVRDMKHAKYVRFIKGDEISLRRIALMYEDLEPNLVKEKEFVQGEGWVENGKYVLVIRVEMSVWNEMVKHLGLIRNKEVRMNREWRIA